MRRMALTLMALVLLLVSAPTRPKHSDRKQHLHHTHGANRSNGSWDPGYTLDNPFGLPPWLRRPPRPPR
jgi:hypothetical protein